LRVPAIIEWPEGLGEPRVTAFPAATMDIFPTLVSVAGLDESVMLEPLDGMDLTPLFRGELGSRDKPIPFRHTGRAALVDNNYKLVTQDVTSGEYELYDLESDPMETTDIAETEPEVANRLREELARWNESVEASIAGRNYPEGTADPSESQPRTWTNLSEYDEYEPYFEEWRTRPEFAPYLE
jgi:arylsulfatase A-like enzyme